MNPSDMDDLFVLAHLQLPDSEREVILRQIDEIIAHVNRLQTLSLPESSLYYYPNVQVLPLRADQVRDAGFKEVLLQNVPAAEGPYVVTPPVIVTKGPRGSTSEPSSEEFEFPSE